MTKQKLSQLDERMAVRDDIKTAIIYSMRNWQAYYMQPVSTHSHDDYQYLEKAYLGAMAAHRQNQPSARLFSLAIFMAIESRHLDTATDMLDAAMTYRSFLKANEPFYLNVFNFLKAYLAIIENRGRAAKKYHKAFLSHIKAAEDSPYYDVMVGQLHLAASEYAMAYINFANAYKRGCRSMYLLEGLFRSLSAADPHETGEELLPTLIYAAMHGSDISRATAVHEDAVFAAIMQDPAAGERLYALSRYTPLLKPVCANRMHNKDFSLSAHKLYSQAIKQQIDLGGLSAFLIQSSYINHIDKISSYPLARFLASANMEPQLAAYVYHIMLTDSANANLIHGREDMALQAAVYCLESGISGREANSLFQYYWTHCKSTGTTGELVEKAEAELHAGLTQFELTTSKDTRYVYIALQEKRGTYEYVIAENDHPENHRLIIEATNENFSSICLGAGRRSVITKPLIIKRVVPLANPALYQYFFDKGDRSFYVTGYLASHYLQADSPETGVKAVPVFEAILAEKSLHKSYRMKILSALGLLYHVSGSHTKALECYTQIDMTTLPQTYLQQTLQVCLQTKEHALAAELIAQNHKSLPTHDLYEGLHQLLQDAHAAPGSIKDTQKHLAEAAFSLLLSGYYSETLLTVTLTHYHASLSELRALSQVLKTPDSRLDTKILSGDLWAHQYDIFTQKSFRRLITANKAQKECTQFIDYCTYAMLTKNLAPEYEVINILEKYYMANVKDTDGISSPNNLLLLALCHTYLHHNITTFRSDKLLWKAVSTQEATDILLPIFKDNKPIHHPYLEKYQPFLHQSQPGKDIHLYYRLDDTKDFLSIPMQYLAYGLYTAKLPLFYNETVTYYYSDEMPTGSITTHQASHKNITPFLHDYPQDIFYAINNAIIHEQMFRHQEMEAILDELVKSPVKIRGQLL